MDKSEIRSIRATMLEFSGFLNKKAEELADKAMSKCSNGEVLFDFLFEIVRDVKEQLSNTFSEKTIGANA